MRVLVFGTVALLACGSMAQPAKAQQIPQTTSPSGKPVKIGSADFIADDDISNIFVIFGNTATGNGLADADPSTLNLAQFNRTMADLGAFKLPMTACFATGGLVSYGTDLDKRLDRVKKAYTQKIPMYTTIGNEALSDLGVFSDPASQAWQAWTSKNGWSKVTKGSEYCNYTVTLNKNRFVMLDTMNPKGIDLPWLKEQAESAEKDKTVEHIFYIGARPLIKPSVGMLDPLTANFTTLSSSNAAAAIIAAQSKSVAYLCSMPSLFNGEKLFPDKNIRQIYIGNGGGPLDEYWVDKQAAFYGFATINVYSGGAVSIRSFQRSMPKGQAFYAASPAVPLMAQPGHERPLYQKPRPPRK